MAYRGSERLDRLVHGDITEYAQEGTAKGTQRVSTPALSWKEEDRSWGYTWSG